MLTKYGLGSKRTLDQLIEFTGIDVRNGVVFGDRCVQLKWVPFVADSGTTHTHWYAYIYMHLRRHIHAYMHTYICILTIRHSPLPPLPLFPPLSLLTPIPSLHSTPHHSTLFFTTQDPNTCEGDAWGFSPEVHLGGGRDIPLSTGPILTVMRGVLVTAEDQIK